MYLVPVEARRECWDPGIGVIDGYEQPNVGAGDPDPILRKRGLVFLTTEPSLQSLMKYFLASVFLRHIQVP